jgi:hypothetical protein
MIFRFILACLLFWGVILEKSFSQRSATGLPGILQSDEGLTGELFQPGTLPDSITFVNPEWQASDIFLQDGRIIRNKMIKYNGLLDELLWLEPESKKTIKLDKEAILSFHFHDYKGDTGVYYRKINVKQEIWTDSVKIFAEEIYTGKLSLFIFHSYAVVRKEQYLFNGISYRRDIYAEEPAYYFRFDNNRTVGFKDLSGKKLYGYLPDQKDTIKKYLKEHPPVNTWDRRGLIQLTRFLETLVY